MSLAGFYKDLKTYIYNQTIADYDFSDFFATLPPDYFGPGANPVTTGRFTEPVNGEGGNLKGLELSVALTGELFTQALTGFGAILSISETRSSITIEDPSEAVSAAGRIDVRVTAGAPDPNFGDPSVFVTARVEGVIAP